MSASESGYADVRPPGGVALAMSAAIVLPLLAALGVRLLSPALAYDNAPLHSSIEGLGAFGALALGVMLLMICRYRPEKTARYPLLAGALFVSAVFDVAHASVAPGSLFVWLHSMAVLFGGILFASVCLPERLFLSASMVPGVLLMAAVSVIAAAYSLAFPDTLPVMVFGNEFTPAAMGINIAGGMLFSAAAARFAFMRASGEDRGSLQFAVMCALFAESALLFPISQIWRLDWWLWHAIRLAAYMTAAIYILDRYYRAQTEVISLNAGLEERVAIKTAELEKEVAARKDREAALSESEARLKQMLEAMPVGVFIVDRDGRPYYANPESKRILGKGIVLDATTDTLPEVYQTYKTESNIQLHADELPIVMALKTGKKVFVSMDIHVSNTVVPIDVSASPIFDADGNVAFAIASFKDVTEQMTAKKLLQFRNRKLEEANRELERMTMKLEEKKAEAEEARLLAEAASRAKSDFLANMSHELRTPLNSILGFTDVMASGLAGPVNDEQKDYMKDVSESARHLLNLINDILDLSKVEAGKMTLDAKDLSVEDLMDGCQQMFREKALRHNIRFTAEVKDPGAVYADERKLKQIMLNLLSNAFKFTPDGGNIALRTYSDDACGRVFCVADTGPGISKEDQLKLFKPFQQLETAITKAHSGTGLGLNLCKKFVKLHKGRIWVESEPGKGARFFFSIPAYAKAA